MSIDLNADVGEGCDDAALMPLLSSANVACGGHAGDPASMHAAVESALRHGVRIGAHPSYVDREGFGRRDQDVAPETLAVAVASQVRALAAVAARAGTHLTHVKPHGALYNRAARDGALARVIAGAVAAVDRTLVLVGLAGSLVERAAAAEGLVFAAEAFADRRYARDGSLLPRDRRGAVLHDPAAAALQALSIARDGAVLADDGTTIGLRADTLCLHGDTPGAVAIAGAVRAALLGAGIAVAGFRAPAHGARPPT